MRTGMLWAGGPGLALGVAGGQERKSRGGFRLSGLCMRRFPCTPASGTFKPAWLVERACSSSDLRARTLFSGCSGMCGLRRGSASSWWVGLGPLWWRTWYV